ncbi:hypothetical protein [Streptomyces sp. NBC_00996]|uniref:hypothetical protein n=1 Tax=Streptomyces sp. NBC_00996 TaxID=2903710 RepID=UPI003863EB8F|nr:hypothetical protein OG390_48330 [Streptomyces sp. NBC_00996]
MLGVPADTFPLGNDVYTTVVVNNYPKWPHDGDTPTEDKLLLEHADSSALTVLHQRGDYAGLQGQRPAAPGPPYPSGRTLSRCSPARC